MSKSNVNKQILDYLKDQNRPYSVIDIHNNLHKEHGKTAVIKALESLVNDGKVKEKTYGKQKIYFVDQNEFPNSKNADLQQMDAEINNMNNTLNDLQKQIKTAESELGAIDKSLTTEEAETELQKIKNELPQLRSKLESLESNIGRVKPEEKDALYEARKKYCKEWQKRKRLVNDMIDAILEGYPKTKKHLFEEIGIETDGDLKVFTC
ncbi:homologous-pairing protein 2 homolog [Trichonephila inaurata madagascariensis]|uniref:Homologous-pairing protein 2 homolog n=1 Tax=Trichonephila inaurata madagascariensis TaxID=2747483 RepID=A0A8X6I9Y6_9ARAC|nr:homologous-pairing protein 2 homolog [Trichonephila inaurata madagascariensis]